MRQTVKRPGSFIRNAVFASLLVAGPMGCGAAQQPKETIRVCSGGGYGRPYYYRMRHNQYKEPLPGMLTDADIDQGLVIKHFEMRCVAIEKR